MDTPPTPVGPRLFTVREGAAFLGVPERRLRSWIDKKYLPTGCVCRMGRAIYLVRAELEQWLRDPAAPNGQDPEGSAT
jgi:excisionase family DNA binding protein